MTRQLSTIGWLGAVMWGVAAASAIGQTRTFDGGGDGVHWTDPANWDAGDVPDVAGESAVIDGPAAWAVDLNGAAIIDQLTIGTDDELSIKSGAAMRVLTGIQNANRLTVSGFTAELIVDGGPLTVTGGGRIELKGPNARIVDPNSTIDGELINADNTIAGEGRLGDDALKLTNQSAGVIDADVAGKRLIVNPPGGPTLAWRNAGAMRATNGGILEFEAGHFDNAGGRIESHAGAIVEFTGGSRITGGTIAAIDGGRLQSESGISFWADLTLDGTMDVVNNSNLSLDGTINNIGTIELTSTGAVARVLIDDDAKTLTGGGTIVMTGPKASITDVFGDADGGLINLDNTIRGEGQLGANRLTINNLLDGTIAADLPGKTLTIDPVGSASWSNAGALRAENGGALRVTDATDNAGSIVAAFDSRVKFDAALTNQADGMLTGHGTIEAVSIENAGTIAPGGNTNSLTFDTSHLVNTDDATLEIEIAGLAEGVEADLLTVAGTFEVNGTLSVMFLPGVESLLPTDQLRIVDAASLAFPDGPMTFDQTLATGGPFDAYDVVYDEINGDIWLTNFRVDVATVPGDANGDGRVDLDDLNILAGNWQAAGAWADGDFSEDGIVDVVDLGILASNWLVGVDGAGEDFQSALTETAFAAPEPTAALLLGAGWLLLTRRRPSKRPRRVRHE